MLSDAEIIAEFEAAEAILRGHFILSSGLHSDTYLQCARVLMNSARADKLCAALAEKVKQTLASDPACVALRARGKASVSASEGREGGKPPLIDMVVAPAMGGVVVGYEMGRQLGVETIFCERENGEFALRRGFRIEPGARVLMVEDVVTTGKSSMEAVKCVEAAGGVVIAEASLIDRSGGAHALPFPLISLLTLDVKTYQPDALPSHLQGTEAVKPGSRWLQKKA